MTTDKRIEELLKPRWKIIADWPGKPFGFYIGKVLTEESAQKVSFVYDTETMDSYPHLFKPLQWWEDRKPEEMPEYIKYVRHDNNELEVYKVKRWYFNKERIYFISNGNTILLDELDKPATREEYDNYQNPKPQTI